MGDSIPDVALRADTCNQAQCCRKAFPFPCITQTCRLVLLNVSMCSLAPCNVLCIMRQLSANKLFAAILLFVREEETVQR